jgi:hypothetical protein
MPFIGRVTDFERDLLDAGERGAADWIVRAPASSGRALRRSGSCFQWRHEEPGLRPAPPFAVQVPKPMVSVGSSGWAKR